MIKKEIVQYLQAFSDDLHIVNKLLVAAYIEFNTIKVSNNKLILSYIQGNDKKRVSDFISLMKSKSDTFDFEDMINLFEITISREDAIENGAVYTPRYIRDHIVEESINRLKLEDYHHIQVADISCGSGAFLYTSAKLIKSSTKKSFYDIYRTNIFGLDISSHAIHRTKILLSLLAVSMGEDIEKFDFNLFVGNALDFNWLNKCHEFKGFDLVVGNPPYVRTKHLEEETKALMKRWKVASSGNADLYIPFFEIGLKYLKQNGILGYITVNTFKRSVNARNLRSFFKGSLLDLTILDFGAHQVFENKMTYTAIVFIENRKRLSINYKKVSPLDIKQKKQIKPFEISYKLLDSHKGWMLAEGDILNNIHKIETTGKPLGETANIKNGLATLCNSIFIFFPIREDELYYYRLDANVEYKIEKSICREAIKPNKLKQENQIHKLTEKIIFPYSTDQQKKAVVLEEEVFQESYPYAYNYLEEHKKKLMNRDKGKPKKYKWYEFGRSQSINDSGQKIFFPYMSNQPYFVYSDKKDLLFYAGYAIYSDSLRELRILEKILKSKVFWYYISHTSKPYSSNYFALAKNYVKDFGICHLSNEEEEYILKEISTEKINDFLINKYKIAI